MFEPRWDPGLPRKLFFDEIQDKRNNFAGLSLIDGEGSDSGRVCDETERMG
ncbi:hypothetical protein JF544_06955 [Halobacillus kuroshimensis]|uniref:Uncharacterized protein n=1 Tax=Halobacillus kuroshimensis TaxID=302481 RepID=A0ABS3DUE3_9BACI|nr:MULTISPECIES: hypothetical protein [Halobacillus]MBN8234982.1 hypothetical protein [Halobacillus kuroshimensis]